VFGLRAVQLDLVAREQLDPGGYEGVGRLGQPRRKQRHPASAAQC
jgi:hypothetical protein